MESSKKWLLNARYNEKLISEPHYQQHLISKEQHIIKDKAVKLFRLMIDVPFKQYKISQDFPSYSMNAKRRINTKLEEILLTHKNLLQHLKGPPNFKQKFREKKMKFKGTTESEEARFERNFSVFTSYVRSR